MNEERIQRLMTQFNGVIKYAPMLQDHPDWTDEQCIAYARKWHKKAQEQYAKDPDRWNIGVHYCRNVLKHIDVEA